MNRTTKTGVHVVVLALANGLINGTATNGISAFYGIPYAEAPFGENRFKPPVPRKPWGGVLDASSRGPAFPQAGMGGPLGPPAAPTCGFSEDSLRLNVWSPVNTDEKLPVLVFVHGGAWVGGSGSDPVYDGSRFARDGVVAVTVNYRLGAEGFLYLQHRYPELSHTGNLGVLDQLMALRWVQENIEKFGGDPARVTLAGESAGAMTISMLVAAEASRGLFAQAILQSGALQGLPVETASRIADLALERLGLMDAPFEELARVDPDELIRVQDDIYNECGMTRDAERFGAAVNSSMPFQPVYFTDLFPESPVDALRTGRANAIRVLAGTNAEEMLILLAGMKDIFNVEQVQSSLDSSLASSGRSGVEALEIYSSSRPGATSLQLAAAVETDRMMRVPTIRFAEEIADAGGVCYVYEFMWQSNANPKDEAGSHHFLEIPFVFHTLESAEAKLYTGDDAPEALADTVHGAWVAFVKTGDPGTPALADWSPYSRENRRVMQLSEDSIAVVDPHGVERELWQAVL